MTDPSAIEAAARRLATALDALEAAVERHSQAEQRRESVAAQLDALGADRLRLAAELDAVSARAHMLEDTNREIARRLDAAIATIRSVLDAQSD